ncbi:restriction endonuclease subunit S [uncultured Haemophilus sp.]|uniref:restriction endonuclease subunit S n=1 Tax=uncultured Haemophilus sp. TaxID=237779 RepID=UPI0026024988|nr:restriction endonuclease subunit S [uncultured Haemophilus sp.]
MRRYESYKDSGVEWLGEVPSHWEVKKMKFLFQDTSIKNKPDETLLSVTQNRGVIPRDWLEERTVMPSGSLETFKFIEKDDFAISLRSFEGGLEICHHDGIISPAYTVLKYNKKLLNNGYYKYLFKCQKFISEMQTSIVGIREGKNISYEELKYSFLPIPQTNEQQKISQFLDDKTAKIDQAVDLAEKQIALLKEHKQILIQNAVTRGLNPDVPLKDSGVEWIGQVPEHWEVKKITHIFPNIGSGTTPNSSDPSFYEGNINWLQTGDLTDGYIYKTSKTITHKALQAYSTLKIYPKNSLVIAMYGATIGKVGLLQIETTTNQACCVLSAALNIEIKYIFYLFQGIKESLVAMSYGGGQPNISQEKIKSLKLPFPNSSEQEQIADYLDKQTAKIDQAIALKTAHIEKLKEYKNVLINDVVTGKVRVSV